MSGENFTGGEGNGQYTGTAGNDTVDALGGNDTLDGAGGDDSIKGGTGDDLVYGDTGNDTIEGGGGSDTLLGEDGADTIRGEGGNDSIVGGAGSDSIDGGAGNDTLRGDAFGDQGDDTISGGDGEDTIDGGGGNDSLSGGSGDDSISDTSGASSVSGGSGRDTITTSAEADTIDAGDDDDVVFSNGGNDSIEGGKGNDSIMGGDGEDRLIGGSGNDRIIGDGGNDTVVFAGPSSNYIFELVDANVVVTDTVGTDGIDTLSGVEHLEFTDGSFELVTGTDGDDSFGAGSAPSVIVSGDGTDNYGGGSDSDIIQGGDGVDNVGGGGGNDTIYAGDGNDGIGGDAGDDVIYGGAGNDQLEGGTGDDTFEIDETSEGDTVVGGDEGGDTDSIDFSNTAPGQGVSVVFDGDEAGTFAMPSTTSSGEFSQIERIEGTDSADTINAGASTSNQTVEGGGGDDQITGGSGDDALSGGDGNDTIIGGGGNDTITGGDGSDSLDGGDGADTIISSKGNNTIDGGAGDDQITAAGTGTGVSTIKFGTGSGNDTVSSFDATEDLVELGPGIDDHNMDVTPTGDPSVWIITIKNNSDDSLTLNFSGTPPADEAEVRSRITDPTPDDGPLCLTPGARVLTVDGPVRVEMLRKGQRLITRDHGLLPLCALLETVLTPEQIASAPNWRPVVLPEGALGGGLPTRRLRVSPQHSFAIRHGTDDALLRARHIVEIAGLGHIERSPTRPVHYLHILLERHALIHVDGVWTESCLPGAQKGQSTGRCLPLLSRRDSMGIGPPALRAALRKPLSQLTLAR